MNPEMNKRLRLHAAKKCLPGVALNTIIPHARRGATYHAYINRGWCMGVGRAIISSNLVKETLDPCNMCKGILTGHFSLSLSEFLGSSQSRAYLAELSCAAMVIEARDLAA